MTREEGVARLPRGKQMALHGETLERAVSLYEAGTSMEAVARAVGMPCPTVQNGVMAALCVRRGHRPAERDGNGYLAPVGLERLREMLRKGMKGVEIQLRLGVSASTISNERRRYDADLKARGKRPLPRPGGGEMYCGARLSRDQVKEIESLLMTGRGSQQVAKRTGVSSTSVIRLRHKLVKRLARKGQALAGCDKGGKRVRLLNLVHSVPDGAKEKLRDLILDRVPISRAAVMANVGTSFAYSMRDAIRAEFAERGEALPPPIKLGRTKAREADFRAAWLPKGRSNIVLHRQILSACGGDEQEARRRTIRAIAERDGHDPVLAEQFDRLRRGGSVVATLNPRRADHDFTLGGVATGMI
jgi:transposase